MTIEADYSDYTVYHCSFDYLRIYVFYGPFLDANLNSNLQTSNTASLFHDIFLQMI